MLFAESPVRVCIIKIDLSLPFYGVIVSGNKNIPRLLSKIDQTVDQDCTWTNYLIWYITRMPTQTQQGPLGEKQNYLYLYKYVLEISCSRPNSHFRRKVKIILILSWQTPVGKLLKHRSNCRPRTLINIAVLQIDTDFHSGKESHTHILQTIFKKPPML